MPSVPVSLYDIEIGRASKGPGPKAKSSLSLSEEQVLVRPLTETAVLRPRPMNSSASLLRRAGRAFLCPSGSALAETAANTGMIEMNTGLMNIVGSSMRLVL